MTVSFGTSFADAREKDIGGIERALQAAFPDCDHFSAYTSDFIRRKLAKEGTAIPSLEETLTNLAAKKYEEVYLQPTHLLRGEEFEQKVLALRDRFAPAFFKFGIGRPLIDTKEDLRLLAEVLLQLLPPLAADEGFVYLGHGTPRANNSAHGKTYRELQKLFDTFGKKVLVGTVENEDSPDLAAVLAAIEERGCKKVRLAPLLVVAGEHAQNDMAGPGPDSWKSRIEERGTEVCCHLEGLGRRPEVQALYVKHLREAADEK